MNTWITMGRLCNEPEIRYTSGENATCIANFSYAVDRRYKNKNNPDAPTADFFRITAMGKLGEFAEKYLHKGTKIVLSARVENNNYTNKDGQKVYSYQFIADNIEFAESKNANNSEATPNAPKSDDFINAGIDDNELNDSLPF